MAGPQVEIEAKLRLQDPASLARLPKVLESLGVRVESAGAKRFTDTYLDTKDRRVGRAGYAFRLRRAADSTTATLKALVAPETGLAVREEHEQRLALGADLPADVLEGRLHALTGGRPLHPLFEVEQERSKWNARGEGFEAEACADRVVYRTANGAARDAEVELELRAGAPDALRALAAKIVAATGWEPAAASKFERGIELAGLSVT